jgi:hypothetical protein
MSLQSQAHVVSLCLCSLRSHNAMRSPNVVVCVFVLATLAQCHAVGVSCRMRARYARTMPCGRNAFAARFLPGGVSMRAERPLRVVRPRGRRARASGRGRPYPPAPVAGCARFGLLPFPRLPAAPFLPRCAPCGSAHRLSYTLLLLGGLGGCGLLNGGSKCRLLSNHLPPAPVSRSPLFLSPLRGVRAAFLVSAPLRRGPCARCYRTSRRANISVSGCSRLFLGKCCSTPNGGRSFMRFLCSSLFLHSLRSFRATLRRYTFVIRR